jgi:hypothetical protein
VVYDFKNKKNGEMKKVKKKEIAFSFIIDELMDSKLGKKVRTKPMFGCHGLYINEKIFCILRQKETLRDDGLWITLSDEGREDQKLFKEFPSLRPIEMFKDLKKKKGGFADWHNLPADSSRFESDALKWVEHVISGDPRFGKWPTSRKK